jgi:serine/threonine-protein kinase
MASADTERAGTRVFDGVPDDRSSGVCALDAPARFADRYDIVGRFGTGGMGVVYRAHDRVLDESVALKVLRDELSRDTQALARFRHEVRLARRVTHRNVARTFDFGEHDGRAYLTMEAIEGGSLSQRLAIASGLPLDRAISIALDVASGLRAAHAAGVVHLDLKPDNILFGEGDRVVITDFGIAVAADAARRPSDDIGSIVGTPAYMAPEQLTRPDALDARVDIYALGLVLYEMLTGDLPWDGKNDIQIARARLVAPPRDPREFVSKIPAGVAELILACLSASADDRVPSIDIFIARLGEHSGRRRSNVAPTMVPPSSANLHLEARRVYQDFWRTSDSIALFERALAASPSDPLVLAGSSLALSRATGMDVDTAAARTSARERAEQAVALAPSAAEPHVALGVAFLQDGDLVGAARHLRRARDLAPTQLDALEQTAKVLFETRAVSDAIVHAELAVQIDPRVREALWPSLMRAHALRGDWLEVDEGFRRRPDNGVARVSYWLTRIRLATWRGDREEEEHVRSELAADAFPHKTFAMLYARFLDSEGRDEVAEQFIAERADSVTCSPRQRTFFHQLAAEVLARCGATSRALDAIDAAVDNGLFDAAWIERCPALDSVRSAPRFVVALETVTGRATLVEETLLGRNR